MSDIDKYNRGLFSNRDLPDRRPRYNDDSDYTTNAPSYYDDLARKNKLIKHLAMRIWDYDKELAKRFSEWDKNLEDFDDEVLRLLQEWINDGTLAEIINEEIWSWKADKVDVGDIENLTTYYVNNIVSAINGVNHKVDGIMHVVNVDEFGEFGESLQAVYDSLPEKSILRVPSGEYVYSTPLVFDREINLDFTGVQLTYEGLRTSPAITIGSEERYTRLITVRDLMVRREGTNLYSIPGETGIRIINVTHSELGIHGAYSFYKGIEFTSGNGMGLVYNQIYFKWIYNNKKSVVITNFDSSGWTNENNFYGGSFAILSANSTNDHVHILTEMLYGYRNNNNKFFGCSFEDAGFNAYAIDCDGGSHYFYGCRYEGSSKVHMRENALDNVIMHGFGIDQVVISGKETAISTVGNRLVRQNVDTRGFIIRPSSTGGFALGVQYFGTDVFTVDALGHVKLSNITLRNRIFSSSDTNILFNSTEDNEELTVGSLLLKKGTYSSLKTRVYGEPGEETGIKTFQMIHSGSEPSRPSPVDVGFMMFDSINNKPIWWDGEKWVDSQGNEA